jgi:heat shock protein HslJ
VRLRAAAAAALLAGCTAAAQAPPLAGTNWQLAELRSNDDAIGVTRVAEPQRYTMAFGSGGEVTLRLDCNRGRGEATVTPGEPGAGRIAFGPIAMTRAMCPPGSLDSRVARELAFVRSYRLEGETLRFELLADGGQQLWRRAAE